MRRHGRYAEYSGESSVETCHGRQRMVNDCLVRLMLN